jgi:chromosome segregation ATPase
MDTTQLAQMVTWLDEQHRRDREELTKLLQRVEAQTGTLQEQSRRIKSLESQLSATKMQLGRFDQIDEALKNTRNELTIMVSSQADDVAKTRRELERARMTDREAQSRAMAELKKELGRLRQIEEEQKIHKTEVRRLGETVITLRHDLNNINKDIDERTRGLPYLVEQRNHDNKRIAQLQQENIELFKRLEVAANKLQSLEYKTQKMESTVIATPKAIDDLKRTQAQFIESLRMADADRQRQMAEWQDTMDAQLEVIEAQRQRFNEMMALRDSIRGTLLELEKFRETMQREQDQVAALQRLAEERIQKNMEAFLGDNEKRWKKQLLDWQYRWDQQEKVNIAINEHFPLIQDKLDLFEELLQMMWTMLDEQSQAHLRNAQKWLSQIQVWAEERERSYKKYKRTPQPE